MKVKQYPGRAVLVGNSVGADSKKMEVMYESSWNDFDWKSDATKLYTNYTDWLQDSSDTNSDTDGSAEHCTMRYYQSYPSHYYKGKESYGNDCSVDNYNSLLIDSINQNGVESCDKSEEKHKSARKKSGRSNNEKTITKQKDGASSLNGHRNSYGNEELERSRLIQKNNKTEHDKNSPTIAGSIHQRSKNSKLEKLIARNGGHDLDKKETDDTERRSLDQYANGYPNGYHNAIESPKDVDVQRWVEIDEGPVKSTITYSKSMRSLKEVSENVGTRSQLKHSKSMRSLKNRDNQRKSPTNEKLSSNSIRKLLKIPEILKTSNGSLNKKETESNAPAISTLRAKSLLTGFENPGMFNDENTDQRLSKLLVNSRPFHTASQSRIESIPPEISDDEFRNHSSLGVVRTNSSFCSDSGYWENERKSPSSLTLKPNEDADKTLDPEINKRLADYYSKNDKEGKSIFKTLTLRLKKKMANKEKSVPSSKESSSSDEYVRAGLYSRQNKPETSGCANVPSDESLKKDSDFTIPRPKLIVPVHTYGIRKRRTGNMMHSIRTRSDDSSIHAGDAKKAHDSSCSGRLQRQNNF